jgi:hypothetical protein
MKRIPRIVPIEDAAKKEETFRGIHGTFNPSRSTGGSRAEAGEWKVR